MSSAVEQLDKVVDDAGRRIAAAADLRELDALRVEYLGKSGVVMAELKAHQAGSLHQVYSAPKTHRSAQQTADTGKKARQAGHSPIAH